MGKFRYTLSFLLVSAALVGCRPKTVEYPPLPSVMPTNLSVEKLLPKYAEPKVDLKPICGPSKKYKAVNIIGGQWTDPDGNTKKLPSGVLISACQFSKENILGKARLKRLKKEVHAYKQLRKAEHEHVRKAEKLYHKRIIELQKPKRKTIWNRIKFGVGLVLGAGVTLGLTYGVGKTMTESTK